MSARRPELQDCIPSAEDRAEAFRLAIIRAREKGSPEGFAVGDPVVVDGIPENLRIKEIRGEKAVVWKYGEEHSERTVAYEDLIDMGVFINEMFEALTEVQFGTGGQSRH